MRTGVSPGILCAGALALAPLAAHAQNADPLSVNPYVGEVQPAPPNRASTHDVDPDVANNPYRSSALLASLMVPYSSAARTSVTPTLVAPIVVTSDGALPANPYRHPLEQWLPAIELFADAPTDDGSGDPALASNPYLSR